MKKLVLLNGPSYSGKDTAGAFLVKNFQDSTHMKMSTPLKRALPAFFGWNFEEVRSLEGAKELPLAAFNNMSWRDMQISLSEDWAKEKFGKDIFGRLFVDRARVNTRSFIINTDCGFREEAICVAQAFGAQNILIVQLQREGCSYEGDSRSYIDMTDIGVPLVELNNNLPLTPTTDMPITFEMQVCAAVRGWLREEQEL